MEDAVLLQNRKNCLICSILVSKYSTPSVRQVFISMSFSYNSTVYVPVENIITVLYIKSVFLF